MDELIKNKSLLKALRVLECFNVQNPELGVTQISEKLGLNKSNVHDILNVFVHAGYIERNEDTSHYRIGLKLLEYAYVINENLGYSRAAYKVLQELAFAVNTAVYFAIPNEEKVLYLEAAYPQAEEYSYPTRYIMGETAPMYCTSLGKAMMPFLTADARDRCINGEKKKFTDNTITDPEILRRELETVRLNGYAVDDCEHEYGIRCIGVPVFNAHARLVGAVSISGPDTLVTEEAIPEYANMLRHAAFRMKNRL